MSCCIKDRKLTFANFWQKILLDVEIDIGETDNTISDQHGPARVDPG